MNFKYKITLIRELEHHFQKKVDELNELRNKITEVKSDLNGPCGFYYSFKNNCVRLGEGFEGIDFTDDQIKELHAFFGEYLRNKGDE